MKPIDVLVGRTSGHNPSLVNVLWKRHLQITSKLTKCVLAPDQNVACLRDMNMRGEHAWRTYVANMRGEHAWLWRPEMKWYSNKERKTQCSGIKKNVSTKTHVIEKKNAQVYQQTGALDGKRAQREGMSFFCQEFRPNSKMKRCKARKTARRVHNTNARESTGTPIIGGAQIMLREHSWGGGGRSGHCNNSVLCSTAT